MVRFQFSLRRSLIAVALVCVGLGLHRQAGQSDELYDVIFWDGAFGICLSVAIGVMVQRTFLSFLAAVIAFVPMMWSLWDFFHRPHGTF
jgi:di/tricarboxylate transporter